MILLKVSGLKSKAENIESKTLVKGTSGWPGCERSNEVSRIKNKKNVNSNQDWAKNLRN